MKNKKIFLSYFLLIVTLLVTLKIDMVNAEPIDATVTITGRNTYGRKLKRTINSNYCNEEGHNCIVAETHWYYNDDNSTTGGTEIVEGRGHSEYTPTEDMVGKYIYVVATIQSSDSSYEPITVSDITDVETNVTAVVGDYIDYVEKDTYSIEASTTHEVAAKLSLTLKGVEDANNIGYYVYFTNDFSDITLIQNEYGCKEPEVSADDYSKPKYVNSITGTNGNINIANDWNILKEYKKAYVVKRVYDSVNGGYYCEINKTPITVSKPAFPVLGERFKYYIFSTDKTMSTFPLFPFSGSTGSHTLKTKIGIINDTNLLKKLAKKTSDSLTSLIEYAKANEGTMFTYKDNSSYYNDIGSFAVTDGAYYYIYTTYDNTDNLYRDIDDVTVAMGEYGMLVNDVTWDSSYTATDTIWEKFVEKYKNTDLIKGLKTDSSDVEITSTDNSLTVKYTNEGVDYITNFKYENGILTYVKGSTDIELISSKEFIINAIKALCDLYGYDYSKATTWLNDKTDLTISKDGIEYILKEINTSSESSISTYETFNLDIVNGLKTYSAYLDEAAAQEKTGIATYPLLALLVLSSGIVIYRKVKNKNKFSQL